VKQRIDVSDLQQLSPEQQEKLRKWWQPQEGDWYLSAGEVELAIYHDRECCSGDYCQDYAPGPDYDLIRHECRPTECIAQLLTRKPELQSILDKSREEIANEYRRTYFDHLKGDCLPLLSIGQMIQLLKEKDYSKLVALDFVGAIQDINLCDLLWQAVKEIL